MGKKKTVMSEFMQKRCVIPARELKKQASKKNDTLDFVKYALLEDYCIKQREKSK